MATRYVLDSHALIWYLEDSPRLGAKAGAILDDPDGEFVLPIIALAEAIYIIERRRTGIPSPHDLLDAVKADPRITLAPLDLDVVEHTLALPDTLEMHDRQIVATALRLEATGVNVMLVTKDRSITDTGLVSIVW